MRWTRRGFDPSTRAVVLAGWVVAGIGIQIQAGLVAWADPSSVAPPAEGLDAGSIKALYETQQMLHDPKSRDEAAKKDVNAAQADQDAKRLAGSSEAAQAVYDLSADVFGTIARESKGDPEKMKLLLMQALKDPAKFAEKFTPEQKARLREISKTIPDPKRPEEKTPP